MPFFKANGATIYYELHGEGPPLILIAGYTCDHSFWKPVLRDLAKNFTVLIYDNRGVGQTHDAGGKLSAKLLADDVMAVAAALKFKAPHIVGHSMGGTIAISIAAEYG